MKEMPSILTESHNSNDDVAERPGVEKREWVDLPDGSKHQLVPMPVVQEQQRAMGRIILEKRAERLAKKNKLSR